MSGYKILYSDIDNMLWDCKDKMAELMESCNNYKGYITDFIGLENFKGEAAESIKAYLTDVHLTIIDSIATAAQDFSDRFLLYKEGYYGIDNSANYALPEETISRAITLYANKYNDFTYENGRIKSALYGISDIFSANEPVTLSIYSEHEELDSKLRIFKDDISQYESETVSNTIPVIEAMLTSLKTSLFNCKTQTSDSVSNYTAGTFLEDENTQQLAYITDICSNFHAEYSEQLEAMWDSEATVRKELEDARKEAGIWQTIGGVVLVVTGAICIVVTAGAATPIVVAGLAAGGGTILFGYSEMAEGEQNIYYGATGNLSTDAINPLRDTVFQGNQEAYDVTKNTFAFAASAMCPLGGASAAGELTFRSGAVIMGKEAAGELAGWGANELAQELDMNTTQSMLLGMGTSFLTSKGLDSIDKRFNISGSIPKPTVEVKIDAELDTRNINGQRTSRFKVLTDDEINDLINDIDELEADASIFRFNQGNQTGFLDNDGIINVRGDVLPDLSSNHPRDLMSSRAALAHEYYGHKYFDDIYGENNPLPGAWNDEFRASYNAALMAPNLSDMDRMYLMMDALERAKEAGVSIKITDTIRRVLYGY